MWRLARVGLGWSETLHSSIAQSSILRWCWRECLRRLEIENILQLYHDSSEHAMWCKNSCKIILPAISVQPTDFSIVSRPRFETQSPPKKGHSTRSYSIPPFQVNAKQNLHRVQGQVKHILPPSHVHLTSRIFRIRIVSIDRPKQSAPLLFQ